MATETANENTGGVVKPVYSERRMRCLTVSESELKQLGLSNWGVTIFASVGSAMLTFGIDLFKDLSLAPLNESATADMADTIQSLCLGGGAICYLVAIGLWLWRRDMIKTIRQESGFNPD